PSAANASCAASSTRARFRAASARSGFVDKRGARSVSSAELTGSIVPIIGDVMPRSPREVAELVRRVVEGKEGLEFPDLFAEDGVLEYPFGIPGQPLELKGRSEIRAFLAARKEVRAVFE